MQVRQGDQPWYPEDTIESFVGHSSMGFLCPPAWTSWTLSRQRFTSLWNRVWLTHTHTDTHTHRKKQYISKHHEGSFWPFLLDLGISMNIKHTTTWPQRRWQYCAVCIFMYFCWPKWLQNFLLRGSEVSGRPWFVGETRGVCFVGCWYVVTWDFFLFLTGIVTNKRPSQERRHFILILKVMLTSSMKIHTLSCLEKSLDFPSAKMFLFQRGHPWRAGEVDPLPTLQTHQCWGCSVWCFFPFRMLMIDAAVVFWCFSFCWK